MTLWQEFKHGLWGCGVFAGVYLPAWAVNSALGNNPHYGGHTFIWFFVALAAATIVQQVVERIYKAKYAREG